MPNTLTFSDLNLNNSLLKAVEELGYKEPTAIQGKVFSVVMSGKDVLGIAQTGTGKTVAYLLPCIRQWKFTNEKNPQILVLVPTRELAVQVVEEVKKLAIYTNLRAAAVYGGTNIKTQLDLIAGGLDLIVATPGRLLDLALTGVLKVKSIKKLVIDEVDEMLTLGFQSQIVRLLDLMPQKKQALLFSATITDEVELLIKNYFNSPIKIEAAPAGTPLENISQKVYHVPNFYTKVNLLEHLLNQKDVYTKVLIFTGGRPLAEQLFKFIEPKFPEQIGIIHSSKDQRFRFNSVKKFKDGTNRVLIATDVIARGLDIMEVSHVINFDLPDAPENYIHRIGRTGRADKEGIAISFATEREKKNLSAIESLMNYTVPEILLPETVVVSTILTEEEKPKVFMKNPIIKMAKKEISGPAFHEKKAKNKKVNIKITRADSMKLKYGKPKTRGSKKKGG